MSGWLTQLPERTRGTGELASWVDAQRPVYLVLDQRRYPEASADLLGKPGKYDFVTLFATTPLAPLIDASPWLIELEVGSEAWQYGEALCREQRLGWSFQPAHNTRLDDLVDHLRRLFVLDDPHGGQSLINIQDPAAWTALLATLPGTSLPAWLAPLGRVFTPIPQRHWLAWHEVAESEVAHEILPLTREGEAALRAAPGAWWLSRTTETPLYELPEAWLARLARLNRAGITRADHLRRLLEMICQPDDLLPSAVEQTLVASLPPRKKVHALESLT
ncbi:DUF4123 domain-containing protein [Franzmannia qiaohouensis]|uniref:DUF4123 domain-containing protein n=1 Tax=Franzmannia qiaohouensis TaxID=1329370 RepID=A0ABU1HDX3_9GAMM|nr:DUF4123 domain-containing protein [Halomonas qiaohouensis]MDR5905683.1 DUF4123 domain-containing protein [Halomonas qiaohouensis]